MAKHYNKKNSSASKRGSQQSNSAFSVFISGFILGIVACQILPYLLKSGITESISVTNSMPVEAPAKPDFQFPNLLKGAEINIPRAENNSSEAADANYLLQVGSFKNIGDAETLRVKLLLLNLDVFTEAFKTPSGDEWHRVLVGPFDNKGASSKARNKLTNNDLDSLLLKRNKL